MTSTGLRWPGLDGRRALVTGSSRGIGRAVALELAAAGAQVIVTARSEESAAATVDEIRSAGGRAEPFALDLSLPEDAMARCEELAKRTKEDGGIPFLVLNAGMTRDGLLMRMSLDAWQAVVTANLTGAFVVTRALLPGMIRARLGRIVAITSVVGRTGNAGQANYCAAKAGMVGFVRATAREVASRGITVNAVAPGFIDTDMTRVLPEETRQKLLETVPLGRLGTVGDVATSVAFLLSDLASYITGEVLDVNGGMDM